MQSGAFFLWEQELEGNEIAKTATCRGGGVLVEFVYPCIDACFGNLMFERAVDIGSRLLDEVLLDIGDLWESVQHAFVLFFQPCFRCGCPADECQRESNVPAM